MNAIEQSIDQFMHAFCVYLHTQQPSTPLSDFKQWYVEFKTGKMQPNTVPSNVPTISNATMTCVHVFRRGKQMGKTCGVIVKDGFTKCLKHRRAEDTLQPAKKITEEMVQIDLNAILTEEDDEPEDEVEVEDEADVEEPEDDEKENEDGTPAQDEEEEEDDDEELLEEDDCDECVNPEWDSDHSADEY